jgi:hypothetical protein
MLGHLLAVSAVEYLSELILAGQFNAKVSAIFACVRRSPTLTLSFIDCKVNACNVCASDQTNWDPIKQGCKQAVKTYPSINEPDETVCSGWYQLVRATVTHQCRCRKQRKNCLPHYRNSKKLSVPNTTCFLNVSQAQGRYVILSASI